jgi:hypothetical protein
VLDHSIRDTLVLEDILEPAKVEDWTNICAIFSVQTMGKVIIMTPKGDMGLTGLHVRKGDEIWALATCPLMMVLRPRGSVYEVLGPAQIAGPFEEDVFNSPCIKHLALREVRLY